MQNSSIKHNCNNGVEILVRGTVQGVGFRPFVYRLAKSFFLRGSVTNNGDGVTIQATGQPDHLDLFQTALAEQAPPLARITEISARPFFFDTPPDEFIIAHSDDSGSARTAIPPDIAICDDCLAELRDGSDRRFHYPFINCTNCGPRFTIIENIPYDRPKTSMKVFPMCPECAREYHDPADRRFHAQPNACPVCGPQVALHDRAGLPIAAIDPIDEATNRLVKGQICALRGLGGFHLICDATSETVVQLLRSRKGRPDKPLAVMMPDLATVASYCKISPAEEKMLLSPERPIVLLRKLVHCQLAEGLAPRVEELGVMLPYTPLHYLLFSKTGSLPALVMTSGNFSSRPICTTNEDGLAQLQHIADFFLLHNREIVTRVDDSVVKIRKTGKIIYRRARGFAPSPITINTTLPPVLACGGGLKSTFCLGRGESLFVSQHIGDLENLEIFHFYKESIDHLKSMLQIEPQAVICDGHPDLLSSQYAASLNLPLYTVQHHHAHGAAVMAEHQLDGEVLALILDGTGLGTDNTIWGGEILRADLQSFTRVGHFTKIQLPGGDAAAIEPWRMALSALYHTYGESALHHDSLSRRLPMIDGNALQVVASMLKSGFNTPLTSSCGRVFDAIASLLGLRQKMSFEGQAAMELEACARSFQHEKSTSKFNNLPSLHSDFSRFFTNRGGNWEILTAEFVKMVVDGMSKNEQMAYIAHQFHCNLIGSLSQLLVRLANQTALRRIVLAGGCMQNTLLLDGLTECLEAAGLAVYTGNLLPVNDGAISAGQALIGGLQHVSCNTYEGDRGPGRSR